MADNLPSGFQYYKDISSTLVRTKFTEETEIEEWIKAYMELTRTAWSIKRTIRTDPLKARKHIFKRIYHCYFKTFEHKLPNTRKRDHASRNIDCPAEIEVVIKYVPKYKSRAKSIDSLLTEWPCVISFKNNHNHTINSAAALIKRPISCQVIEEIKEYFDKGHSPSSAYHSFCFKKMEQLEDKYESMVMDRYYFPTKNDFGNLWKKHFKLHYGETTGEGMFSKLLENLNNSTNVSYRLEKDIEVKHYVLSLCSPIMQRAAKLLNQSSEILFVDATSNCDVQSHKLYFFATHSAAGSIPVGCIISTSQKQDVFSIGVNNLIAIMPKINPSVIITDDDLVERNVLKKYWPQSKILLCTFHVLKSVWKWLTLSKNNIPKEDRQALYAMFRKILMSINKEELDENLKTFENFKQYPQYKKYINEKIEKIDVWCLYHRKHLITRGSNTNNYIEVMFRLFKDIPLERTKAYNLPQLADFVITDFENYYKQRILDVVFNKITKSTLKRLCPDEKDVTLGQICDLGDMQFSVSSCKSSGMKYFVDMKINVCSCPQGESGKICKHQSAIIINCNVNEACNTLTLISRNNLYEIATGNKPGNELFLPLIIKDASVSESIQIQSSNSAEISNDVSSSSKDASESNLFRPGAEIDTAIRQEATKEKWDQFINILRDTVKKNIDDDPEGYIPAVEVCLNSYNKNVNSASTLMSSLYQAFKPNNTFSVKSTRQKISRKGKKISVQPTSIARRKVQSCGRRKVQSGKKVSSFTKKKPKAPHHLQACVDRNIPLGDNKFAK